MSRRARVWPLCLLLLSGCVSEYTDATPQQYEQAKADCAPHEGLKRVRVGLVLLSADLLESECTNDVRVTRKVNQKQAPASGGAAMSLLQQRISELASQHGSLRAAARVLQVDAGYLSRLQSGEKNDPGEELLRKLRLRRVVTFEATEPK